MNYLTLPVIYSEDFYDRLTNYQRYSTLGYVKDVLVGAITCRYEEEKEDTPEGIMQNPRADVLASQTTKGRVVYIMTISVLKAYRRYGIGT